MSRLRIGINGFGRIGRAFTRIALERSSFDIVAINTLDADPAMLSYLLQYDSVYRKFSKTIDFDENNLIIEDKKIALSSIKNPTEIGWDKYGVDVVIDATGAFTRSSDLRNHIHGTVRHVVLTSPAKDDETKHVVIGVNDDEIDFANTQIISNASCTTNCAGPLFKILNDYFGINSGFLNTAHAYTQSQTLLDESNKEFTRSRAAALSIIPSTTGASKAIGQIIPALLGKVDGMSIRVPVPTVSFVDITANVDKSTSREEVNEIFKKHSEEDKKNILSYATDQLVSSDYIGSSFSAIFDSNYTQVINGKMVKVYGWYDNEWGYSTRLADLVERFV